LDAGEKVLKVLEAARRDERPVAIAHALRWQVDRLLRDGQLDVALTLVEEAVGLAAAAGLTLLGGELHELWGRLLLTIDAEAAAQRFGEGLDLAHASGFRVVEILCQAGIGQASPGGRLDRLEAPRRLEAILEPLDEPERQDFLAWPERALALRLGLETGDLLSADRLQQLTDLIALVTSAPDLPRVMQHALTALVETASAERGFLLLYNGFEVTQRVYHGMDEGDDDEFSSGLAYQVLWSGEPLFVEDASSHTEFMGRASVQALALRSVVAVPLNDGHETVGVMMADSQRINARFTPQDLDLAMALARQVAIAITNTRRLQRYQNAFDEAQVLQRLALAMLGHTTVEGAMAAVAGEALPLSGASRALLLSAPDLAPRCAFDATGGQLPAAGVAVSQSVSGWVLESGKPLHLVDAQTDENFQSRQSVVSLDLHTIVAVPVAFGERKLGVLYLDHPRIVEEDPTALHTLARIGEMLGAFLARLEG
jgi:GAF domain-containing protein